MDRIFNPNNGLVKSKLRITAENFFAVILLLKTLSFLKAVFLYIGF
jgi:hypothetical protein